MNEYTEGDDVTMRFMTKEGKRVEYVASALNYALCRNCDQEILWVETRKGKKFPANAHATGNAHDSHIRSCPKHPSRPAEAPAPSQGGPF